MDSSKSGNCARVSGKVAETVAGGLLALQLSQDNERVACLIKSAMACGLEGNGDWVEKTPRHPPKRHSYGEFAVPAGFFAWTLFLVSSALEEPKNWASSLGVAKHFVSERTTLRAVAFRLSVPTAFRSA